MRPRTPTSARSSRCRSLGRGWRSLSVSLRPTRGRRAGTGYLCCGSTRTLQRSATRAAMTRCAATRRACRRRRRLLSPSQAYVPLSFDPGEAYQFDWSHEYARLAGATTRVKAAHMRLCYSRMQLVQIFPREGQEMVFEAHERSFRFFGGACRRGIYDNMKTAVTTVFVGKKRDYNRRFQAMCSHHLVEPVACTPGAGWEKGPGREAGGRRPRSSVRAHPPRPVLCRDQRVADGSLHRGCQEAAAPDDPGQDGVAGVRGGALLPDSLPRSLRRLPRHQWCIRLQDLPGALRQQPDTAWRPARSGSRWMCGPTPIGSSSARTARSSPSIAAASDAARSPTSRGTTCRSWSASPVRIAQRRALQGLEAARRPRPAANPARGPR